MTKVVATTGQWSEWSTRLPLASQDGDVPVQNNDINHTCSVDVNKKVSPNQKGRSTFRNHWTAIIHGLIVGVLAGGLIFGLTITLWLTSPKTTISSTTTITTASQTTTSTSTTTTTTIIGCHLCAGSSYAGSCHSCTNSSAGCYINCLCNPFSGPALNSSVTLSTGAGNGCSLGNSNGILTCTGYCT